MKRSVDATEVLQRSVQFVKGVGPRRALLFEKLGVLTIEDLLYLIPRNYEELRRTHDLRQLSEEGLQTVRGRLEYVKEKITRAGQPIVEAVFSDGSGYLSVTWFNRPSIIELFRLEAEYEITGRAKCEAGRWKMVNPKVQHVEAGGWRLEAGGSSGLVPVYPLTEGLHPQAVQEAVRAALQESVDLVPELMPEFLRRRLGLVGIAQALRGVHAPADHTELVRCRDRLAYEEFFVLQVALALKRSGFRNRPGYAIPVSEKVDARIRRLFPFRMTPGQNRVVDQITGDLASPSPMYRLLQGDVASGKTAVAIYAILATIAEGAQSLLMAPTEVLAQQHFRTLEEYLANSRVRRSLLTGSLGSRERTDILERLAGGEIDLVVGTHSLIQKGVEFARLGLVVIDEQHKFGVRQRAVFQDLGQVPNQLVMTATPIPRSLGMTWFGDLDVSVIEDSPPGRQQTLTYVVPRNQQEEAYQFLGKQVRMGAQGLVVCPRIEGEEKEGVRSVTQVEQEMVGGRFRDIEIGVVHGKLAKVQKDVIFRRFRRGDLRVLVSTVVVEVGLDIPSASILIVENAERFGLSQLHQIRGRVGRSSQRGICFLINGSADPSVRQRLDELSATHDGFRIAEIDARIRGIGDPFGERQHGFAQLRVADFFRDARLLELARNEARQLIATDPTLSHPQWSILRQAVLTHYGKVFELALVG